MVRFGVVGTGYWADQVHLPGLQAAPGVELVGVWGRDPEKAAAAAAGFGIRGYTSLPEMLAEVDAVSFAVPPPVQAGLALEAAGAGKHLLLEKPLALTPEDADSVVRAVAASGVAAVVFFTRVFTAEVELAIQDLAARGPWMQCAGHFHAGALRPGTPYSASAWRQRSGALWDIGPHALSVLLPVMGPVTEVTAVAEGDMVRLRLVHAPGGVSETTLTLQAPPEASGERYLFRSGERTAALEVGPAPRLQAYGGAVAALLDTIAGRGRGGRVRGEGGRGVGRYGAAFGAEVTRILHAAG